MEAEKRKTMSREEWDALMAKLWAERQAADAAKQAAKIAAQQAKAAEWEAGRVEREAKEAKEREHAEQIERAERMAHLKVEREIERQMIPEAAAIDRAGRRRLHQRRPRMGFYS
jgi:hypothetical protein